jgi:hypothetical protein
MLALPRKMLCSPTVNVDLLKPFHARADDPPAPDAVSDLGQEGEHEVELLLNRKAIIWILHYLVRWRCHTSADDEWLRAEELAHCPERVAKYDAAAPRRRRARGTAGASAVPTGGVAATAPPVAPAGFRLATTAELLAGAALVGRSIRLHPVPLACAELGPGKGGPGKPGGWVLACGPLCTGFGSRRGGGSLALGRPLAWPGAC